MKTITIFLYFVLLSFYTYSQDSIVNKNMKHIYVSFGASNISTIELNKTLTLNNLTQISNIDYPFFIGIDYIKNGVGFNIESGLASNIIPSKSKLIYIPSRIGLSKVLINHKGFNVGANFNYNYNIYSAKIYYKTDNPINSSSIPLSNTGLLELNTNSNNIGIQLFSKINFSSKYVILRTGYDYSLSKSNWSSTSNQLINFSSETFNKFYFSVSTSLKRL